MNGLEKDTKGNKIALNGANDQLSLKQSQWRRVFVSTIFLPFMSAKIFRPSPIFAVLTALCRSAPARADFECANGQAGCYSR